MWGPGLGLGRCEVRRSAVWPRCLEMMQADREDPAYVVFVDDQDPVEQFRRSVPISRSQIAFARGALGGRVRIRMPSAAKTASNVLVNRESRTRKRKLMVVTRSPRFIRRFHTAWVVHAPVGCTVTPARCARREPCSTAISA
jgi:hypothetical protein